MKEFTADDTTPQVLLKETEKLLEKWKHPDPYAHPTAPGGMLYSEMDCACRCILTLTHRFQV
jgi:hypothetical protein